MTDFETHPRGTTTELRLSRNLANAIEQIVQQYGNVIPQSVRQAYEELHAHYVKQIQEESL